MQNTATVVIEDCSWSIGIYTNEQLEAMSEAQYEKARADALAFSKVASAMQRRADNA